MNSNQLIGIGLRHPHYQQVLEECPSIGWFEVHSENFFHFGGPSITALEKIRGYYPISLHGVGMSLGSAEGIERNHIERLKSLIERIDPFLVSEHLSWGYVDGIYMPDLLPIPYTNENLDIFCRNVHQVQDYLQQEILIENPSSYIEYKVSHIEEQDFLVTLCNRTGAKILLDVNNVFVSCSNHGWDPFHYLNSLPKELIKEIHLAGHSLRQIGEDQLLRVDTHDQFVDSQVWDLYGYAISKFGPQPTLLEWDSDIPSLDVLIKEALKASQYLILDEKMYVNA